MTAQELGLPPRFEVAMKRRLGATGIFVGVSGKYYLDEARLQQIEQRRGGMEGQRSTMRGLISLRMARLAVGAAALILAVVNIFYFQNLELRYLVITLIVIWIALTLAQFFYLSRIRRNFSSSSPTTQPAG